jgi:hypothetical protein
MSLKEAAARVAAKKMAMTEDQYETLSVIRSYCEEMAGGSSGRSGSSAIRGSTEMLQIDLEEWAVKARKYAEATRKLSDVEGVEKVALQLQRTEEIFKIMAGTLRLLMTQAAHLQATANEGEAVVMKLQKSFLRENPDY